MRTGRLIVAFGALAVAGWAQSSAGVSGPVTGFIFDAQSGAVRPMLGIPGGAYLGNAMAAGLNAASVAPDGSTALAVQLGKLVLYRGLRNGTPVAAAVSGGIAGADKFAWAADGSAAAVYSSRSGQAQIVSGLGAPPSGAPAIDLAGLPGPLTAWAFDGQRLILGVSGGVYTATAAAGIQRIASGISPSAMALAGGSLYVADSQAQQIWQIQDYASTPAAVIFAGDSGISSPVGLQVSFDGQRLYAANAGNRTVAVYDIASRSTVQSIALSFVPTRLDRFGDVSVFLLNSAGGAGPVYVVRDGGAGKAAVYFVPSPAKRGVVRAPIRQ